MKTCSVVNVVESSIARDSKFVLPIHCGPEIGVASTKAFLGQMLVLYLFSIKIAFVRGSIDKDKYNMTGDFSYEENKIHLRTTGDIDVGYLNSVMEYNLLNDGVDVDIELGKIPVASFDNFVDDIEIYEGVLGGNLTFHGSLDKPEFGGTIKLDSGLIYVPFTGITYFNCNANLQGNGDHIDLKTFRVRSRYQGRDKGKVSGGGTYYFDNRGEFYLELDKFYVIEDPQISLTLTGKLNGTIDEKITVNGNLDVFVQA